MLRIGHGGAAALTRGNTLASFDAALELEVDMIEFDVRAARGRGSELLLAHSPVDARFRTCPTLHEALRHLASRRFAGLRFNVDVKSPRIEAGVLYALEVAGLTDRCVISCRSVKVLDRFRELDPSVRTGLSVRRAGACAALLRGLEARRYDAAMVHHRLVDAALVAEVRERAGELFAWTVDERRTVDRLREAGVSGVITNDPRLFAPVAAG